MFSNIFLQNLPCVIRANLNLSMFTVSPHTKLPTHVSKLQSGSLLIKIDESLYKYCEPCPGVGAYFLKQPWYIICMQLHENKQ